MYTKNKIFIRRGMPKNKYSLLGEELELLLYMYIDKINKFERTVSIKPVGYGKA